MPPQVEKEPVQSLDREFKEQEIVSVGKRILGRIALTIGLAIGPGITLSVTESAVRPAEAHAETGGYPYADAPKVDGIYSWGYKDCKGYCDGDGSVNMPDGRYYTYSERGFGIRNCTDWASYRIRQLTGIEVPKGVGMGNATTWDTKGKDAGYTVDQTPEPGDVAQNNDTAGGYGHVGVVEKVTKDDQGKVKSIEVSQYNGAGTGNYAYLTYTADPDGTFWLYADKSQKWDNFIDVNGTGVGINGSAVPATNPNAISTPTVKSYSSIGEGGIITDNNWVYKKVGGVVWPIKPKSEWSTGDSNYWSGGNVPGMVTTEEIHANEVGYGDVRAHPAGDNTIVYYDGQENASWYMFYGGKAYYVTSGEASELIGLGYKAQSVPQTQYRLGPFTWGDRDVSLTNRMRYRFAGSALVRLMAQQDGGGFHAFDVNNDTLLSCLEMTDGGKTILLPQSARPYVEHQADQVLVMNHQAACEFRPNMVLNGPGGNELWKIEGNNDTLPYSRRYYPNMLTVYLNSGGIPDRQTLRSVDALNSVAQGTNMDVPESVAYFRVNESQQVFKYENGLLRPIPNKDALSCIGNPPLINVAQNIVNGMSQGATLNCGFENRIIRVGTSDYYVSQGSSYLIQNAAIENCIVVRKGTGQPVPVDMTTSNAYVLREPAHCTYEQEPGLNFVRETGTTTVWLVNADGTKQHVGSLCNIAGKKYQVFEVPHGETGGHRQTSDWFASADNCAALPG